MRNIVEKVFCIRREFSKKERGNYVFWKLSEIATVGKVKTKKAHPLESQFYI